MCEKESITIFLDVFMFFFSFSWYNFEICYVVVAYAFQVDFVYWMEI